MLSGSAADLAASHEHITSTTALYTSLTTAVTGARTIFAATVENARNDAPITAGKVSFVIESPHRTVLGNARINKQGIASIATTDLTEIAYYRVRAEYTPSKSNISASVSAPETVKVIPVPLNVPTKTTLMSGAPVAELGQRVPLLATVEDAGTGNQVDAGKVEPITGKVAFLTDSPNPLVLGEVNLNKNNQAALSTNKLKIVGNYKIVAEFLPANNYYSVSTSAPAPVTITPATVNAPTITTLQAVPNSIETGETVTLNAAVQNKDSSLADGTVKFVTLGRRPKVLGRVASGTFGQQVSLSTDKLKKVGTYEVQAIYTPKTNRFAASMSVPVAVTVAPFTAASFLVTPLMTRGHLGEPLGFAVTALDAQKQPLTNYTGTVAFSSPTDSWTVFPPGVYVSLKISPPPPLSTGLASFMPVSYTFTPADHGTHTFVGAVKFGKAGAEKVQVTQVGNPRVVGKATFAIG
jgi:hypothetical protein